MPFVLCLKAYAPIWMGNIAYVFIMYSQLAHNVFLKHNNLTGEHLQDSVTMPSFITANRNVLIQTYLIKILRPAMCFTISERKYFSYSQSS